MVFDVLTVDELVPEARTPLAIPARVALSFPKPRPLSHETPSFANAHLSWRWHVLIVVGLVRGGQETGRNSRVGFGEKTTEAGPGASNDKTLILDEYHN